MEIRMTDVIDILNLPYPPNGNNSYYIPCPCCDEPHTRNGHLNINLKKQVFRCPKCNVSGGILDLYSLYTGVPRESAYKSITEKIGVISSYTPARRKVLPETEETTEYPITDVDTRNATYSAFLGRLTLAKDHRENLKNRGLNDDEIDELGYKTTPVFGMKAMANTLRNDGFYLSGVPGFYKDNGIWTFSCDQRGIMIPVKDVQGRIQGMQIRRDNTEKRKFRWFSSAEKQDGCRAEGWTHLSGEPAESIILTEGPMKADVIRILTGRAVIAVPGVNSLTHLTKALAELKGLGLKEVKTAFDMDMLTNPNVQNGFNNLLNLLDETGLKFSTYLWDYRYKGLDDYIWECLMNKKR